MIEYRKSQTSIALILIVAAVIAVFASIATQMGTGSSSSSSDLSTSLDQSILDSEPMTITSARIVSPKLEGETDEEYEQRLQEIVKRANEMMEDRKIGIRRLQEKQEARNNEMISTIMMTIGGVTVVLVIGSLISNYVKSRQPIAMVVTEDYVEFKAGMFREENRLYWGELATIEYRIRHYRNSNSDGHSTTRHLYFRGVDDSILDSINLNNLEISDFNTIHRDISRLVPNMEWIYP